MITALTVAALVLVLSLLVMAGCYLGAQEDPHEISAADVYRAAKAKRDRKPAFSFEQRGIGRA